MAQYTTTVYADNSYLVDKNGQAIPVTSEQLTISGKVIIKTDSEGKFSKSSIILDENFIGIAQFPYDPAYKKKRLVQSTHQYYIRSCSYSVTPANIQNSVFKITQQEDTTTSSSEAKAADFASSVGILGRDNSGFTDTFNINAYFGRGHVYQAVRRIVQYLGYRWVFAGGRRVNINLHSAISTAIRESVSGTATDYPTIGAPNTEYTFAASFAIDSYLGQYPPRSIQTYADVAITVEGLYPASGFVNPKRINRFSWRLEYEPDLVGQDYNPTGNIYTIGQKSAVFQWREQNSLTIHTINVGTDQFIDVPANTFPIISVFNYLEWRVQVTGDDDDSELKVSPFSEWQLFYTYESSPGKPTGLNPGGGVRDGTRTIEFSWIYNYVTSGAIYQSAFEVQITYDNGTSWIDLSGKIDTETTSFTLAPNSIIPIDPTGRVGWRVRTYNSNDAPSEWSDTVYFIVLAAPQKPDWIGVEGDKSRPFCRWGSIGQNGYQLQVLLGVGSETVVFDTGEIYGTDTEYKIPEYLNNNTYTFRLRIKNTQGLWSDWADYITTIIAPKRLNITLQGQPVANGAQLTFSVEVKASG